MKNTFLSETIDLKESESSPTQSEGQWEDIREEEDLELASLRHSLFPNEEKISNRLASPQEPISYDQALDDLNFIESTCSQLSPASNSKTRHPHLKLTPKSKHHFYHHTKRYHLSKRSASPSFIHHLKRSLEPTSTGIELVFVNTPSSSVDESSTCTTCEIMESRDHKALENCIIHQQVETPEIPYEEGTKSKSHAPLDIVLERLEYKLKKIEKLEKKSEQEEELKNRYLNVKKKFTRMIELGMASSQKSEDSACCHHHIESILHKAKHNKKAVLYLQSPDLFSHFVSRKALKYYYKLCQIARYGVPKSEFAATRILDNLFLGDIDDAFNEPVLKELGITHIVTCVKSLYPIYPEKGFEYLNLHLYDEEDQTITDIFDVSFNFIEKAISSGSSVLVHCMKGKSRSASVLISYLMKKNLWSYHTALEFVKSKRKLVQPNSGFASQLQQLEAQILGHNEFHSSDENQHLDKGGNFTLCY